MGVTAAHCGVSAGPAAGRQFRAAARDPAVAATVAPPAGLAANLSRIRLATGLRHEAYSRCASEHRVFIAFSYHGVVGPSCKTQMPSRRNAAAGKYLAPSINQVLQRVLEVQATLHGAGTVSADALSAIAAHASKRPIRNSVETGCGATTLLLSHLGENHKVFALDIGNSVSSVRRSAMLRSEVVTFIEGPSQRTLPKHHFSEKLQLALIDGPHAYPFPDLEYFSLFSSRHRSAPDSGRHSDPEHSQSFRVSAL
jgi:hypothetical protein